MQQFSMTRVAILNDGTKVPIIWAGVSRNIMWLSGLAMTFQEALDIFSDADKTRSIILPDGKVYMGFTTTMSLVLDVADDNRLLKVALYKE